MSGQIEASFVIGDNEKARQLEEKQVGDRILKLFAVRLTVASAQAQGKLVTLSGNEEGTEKAKTYVFSLCSPEVVKQCQNTWTSPSFFAETAQHTPRDELERNFQTVILPFPSSPGFVQVQGPRTNVENTLNKIAMMAPPIHTPPSHPPHPPPHTRSLPPYSSSTVTTASNASPPYPTRHQSPYNSTTTTTTTTSTTTILPPSPPIPATTAGAFPSSKSISLSSTQDPQHPRDGLYPAPRDVNRDTRRQFETTKQNLVQSIVSDLEHEGCTVVPRGLDSAQREQTIQYFVSLNFPRDKTESVVNSMGWEADYNDILQRLVNICNPPSSHTAPKREIFRGMLTVHQVELMAGAALRPVVIDGSNVAMRHGNGRFFSCRGIELAVQWFRRRGHESVTVFVPQWRREPARAEYPITDQNILSQLEQQRVLVFTPSRRIGKKKIVCYDDRFIVRLATETQGVIVSNDNFRDLVEENEEWRKTIEQKLVMFTFVNDIFMPADDPLGRQGPSLTQLLQMETTKPSIPGNTPTSQLGPKQCPYGERCTFGKKCRYYHPEREGRSGDTAGTSHPSNSSPVPERRHTGGSADLQKEAGMGQVEQVGALSGRRSKSPHKSFPSQPVSETRTYVPQDPRPFQPELQSYSSVSPQKGYHQTSRDFLPPQDGQSFSHYLRLGPTNGHPPAQAPSLYRAQHLSAPTTPMGGPSPYANRTFPIANLSLPRPRNMTDTIQPDRASLTHTEFNPLTRGGEEGHGIVSRPPTVHNMPPSHQHVTDSLPGLVPRDFGSSYNSLPSSVAYQTRQFDRPLHYPHPQPTYHLQANVYTPNSYYRSSDSPPSRHLAVRNDPTSELGPQPSALVPGQSGSLYSQQKRHSTEVNLLPKNHLYTTGNSLQMEHVHTSNGGSASHAQHNVHLYTTGNSLQMEHVHTSNGGSASHAQHNVHLYTTGNSLQMEHVHTSNGSSASHAQHNVHKRQSMPVLLDYSSSYLSAPACSACPTRISPSPVYMGTSQRPPGPHPHRMELIGSTSSSAPELYRTTTASSMGSSSSSSSSAGGRNAESINWSLFRKAQAALPGHEEEIMRVMQQYPGITDLESLVSLVQRH